MINLLYKVCPKSNVIDFVVKPPLRRNVIKPVGIGGSGKWLSNAQPLIRLRPFGEHHRHFRKVSFRLSCKP